jgi:hypothetical protein
MAYVGNASSGPKAGKPENGWRIPESEWTLSSGSSSPPSTESSRPVTPSSDRPAWGVSDERDNIGWSAWDLPNVDKAGSSLDVAVSLQRQFDKEDKQLRTQKKDLASTVPGTFNCGICLEDTSEFMVARVDPCDHSFCRDCIRDYIRSKISDHRYPILCPICTANKKEQQPGGTFVRSDIAQQSS